MAFTLYSIDDGHVPAWEYLPVEKITPKVGLCLAFDTVSQQLEVSDIPQYICMREELADVSAGTLIPVVYITGDQIWESKLDGAGGSLAVGTTVDVDVSGLLIDADASADNVFQLTYMAGTAQGDTVRGRFVK